MTNNNSNSTSETSSYDDNILLKTEYGRVYKHKSDTAAILLGILFFCMFLYLLMATGIRESTDLILIYAFISGGLILMLGIFFCMYVIFTNKLDKSNSDINSTYFELNKNYNVLRKQTMIGFYIAIFTMIVGTGVLSYAIITSLVNNSNVNTIAIISGILLEFISGTGLFIFKTNFSKLNFVSDELFRMWKIITAFQKADELNDELKDQTKISLIKSLVE